MRSIRTLWTAFVCGAVIIASSGCKQKDTTQTTSTAPAVVDSIKPAPQPNTSAPADKKRSPAQDSLRQVLLKRKGEILSKQRRIRFSESLTPAQKDSALQALEYESIEVSKQLLKTE